MQHGGKIEMKRRKLGKSGLEVSAIGMGCMGFSHGYGATPPEEESIRLMRTAYDLGCTFFDTAEAYGPYVNEELVGKAIASFRDKIVLATKFSPIFLPGQHCLEGKLSRKAIRQALEDSLRRLRTDYVDLYYQHRVPQSSMAEEVALWMGEMISEGKIRGWGQSQSTEEQIRRAHAVTPIAAIQSEYSMMERMFEKDIFPVCEELDIGFVAFSPLASGFLSGKYTKDTTYTGDDVRRVITRFTKENVEANQPLLDMLHGYAQKKNATPAQISLAWMLCKKDFIVPIPGMRNEERVVENFGASEIFLTPEEFDALERALAKITIYGNRTDKDIERLGTIKAQ
jgi:aryl-alcohol dehydrogenase-like predicted oxidoreductase